MDRTVTTSQVFKSDDGDVALQLTISDGSTVMWLMDLAVIASARRQLDRCEEALRSPTQPAQ